VAGLPDAMKSRIIEDVVGKTRRAAETEFLAKHPDVLKRAACRLMVDKSASAS
jgi:hypothetical protein